MIYQVWMLRVSYLFAREGNGIEIEDIKVEQRYHQALTHQAVLKTSWLVCHRRMNISNSCQQQRVAEGKVLR